jgi:hypothetical protein
VTAEFYRIVESQQGWCFIIYVVVGMSLRAEAYGIVAPFKARFLDLFYMLSKKTGCVWPVFLFVLMFFIICL